MKPLILGTAGHIDHGKSSFVKALTGTDPDRLKEEKKRGITIELGFASFLLPNGRRLGIVDVPGHEKFIRNMVAGASGIDLVALVVAADEGVMPQTREHMDICTILGIRYGLVLITKIDMVDEEMLELVLDDISDFTRGTFLEGAPVLPMSSVTGEGLKKFPEIIDTIVGDMPEKNPAGLLRLPVDRVFSMKGFGTVITGTLISGAIRTGDTIRIYPSGPTAKVRGVQVHGETQEAAEAGLRTAINFQGIEKEEVRRGSVLGMPGTLSSSYMLDVKFAYLESNPKAIKNRARVRVHSGTSEILGMLILLDREELAPGESTVAQLRLIEPVVCVKDDKVVLRSYSPIRTIGGGRILNPAPPKHKRRQSDLVTEIAALETASPETAILFHCRQAGDKGIAWPALKIMVNINDKQLQKSLDSLLSSQSVVMIDKEKRVYVHGQALADMAEACLDVLTRFHHDHPLKKGMFRQEIKSRVAGKYRARLFELVLNRLLKNNQVVQEEETLRLADHEVSLGTDQSEIKQKIIDTYKDAGLTPPYVKELPALLGIKDVKAIKDVMALLVESAALVKVKEDLYFHGSVIEGLKDRLIDFLNDNGEIDTPQFKQMTNASRKYTIPLLEYFDAQKVTIRIGDVRKLRK